MVTRSLTIIQQLNSFLCSSTPLCLQCLLSTCQQYWPAWVSRAAYTSDCAQLCCTQAALSSLRFIKLCIHVEPLRESLMPACHAQSLPASCPAGFTSMMQNRAVASGYLSALKVAMAAMQVCGPLHPCGRLRPPDLAPAIHPQRGRWAVRLWPRGRLRPGLCFARAP